jgi:N-acetylmuramoyl-L-alanine amidase
MTQRIYIILLFRLLCFAAGLPAQGNHLVQTVVIDAGHGGKDPGCVGQFIKEKDVALSVGLKLGALIQEYYPKVKIVYTRKDDTFIELHRRATIANGAKADLFISIHVNAASSAAFGAETYVLGLHRTKDNLAVAKRENAAVSLEADYKKIYDGFDPNSIEDNILIAMMQSAYLDQSLEFAGFVQKYLVNHSGRHDRGVRQAGFLVLVRTTMPSVLVELGFASNPEEEKYLGSKTGQEKLAEALFMAFADYKKHREGKVYQGTARLYPLLSHGHFKEPAGRQADKTPIAQDTVEIEIPAQYYSVQLMSVRQTLQDAAQRFAALQDVFESKEEDGWIRYFSGRLTDKSKAQAYLLQVKDAGFSSAFLVGFDGNRRISQRDLEQLLDKKN